MLLEEYQKRRVLPPHLRPRPPAEAPFAFSIRPARPEDLPDVRALYNYYVSNSAVTFDERSSTLSAWKQKFALLGKLKLPLLVAESPGGTILGYAIAAPFSSARAARYVAESSIYLGPAALGKGLGSALLGALIDAAKAQGLRELVAIISDRGADASVALHRKLGFVETGRMGKVGVAYGRPVGSIMMSRKLR